MYLATLWLILCGIVTRNPERRLIGNLLFNARMRHSEFSVMDTRDYDPAVSTSLLALVHHINSKRFRWIRIGVRDYISNGGGVHMCWDIYGPEVRLGLTGKLLDCQPGSYRLRHDEADVVYKALVAVEH